MEAMAQQNCTDCKGAGFIETEGLKVGRSKYDLRKDSLLIVCEGDGNFQRTQCHCVGEDE